ncbi:hypothetical protein HKX48_005817 [Thoreauomyces humboldtii]|nr:hypothetical protein HKX48_005817 [Thoreauomyces humboldtii]
MTTGFNADNLGALYGDVNQGWNSVKIVGMTVIPYCWLILPRTRLWHLLMFGAMLEFIHVVCVMTVYTMVDVDAINVVQQTRPVWAVQSLAAAGVRIVEIMFNAVVISSLQRALPVWQILFFVLTSCAIVFGRLYDVFVVSRGSMWVSVRTGMAIVSISGVLTSAPVIYIFGRELWRLFKSDAFMKSESKATMLLQQSGTRLMFLNLIDVGLVFCFLIPGTPANPYFRWFFDNWDNSRLAYYAVDLLLSKVKMSNHSESQVRTNLTSSKAGKEHTGATRPMLSSSVLKPSTAFRDVESTASAD